MPCLRDLILFWGFVFIAISMLDAIIQLKFGSGIKGIKSIIYGFVMAMCGLLLIVTALILL
jgi:hypothetical protein